MTRQERTKARALSACRMPPAMFDKRFAAAMAHIANTAPETVLTPAQKWALDNSVYRYRRQLVDADIEIPRQPPDEADYFAAAEARRKPAKQAKLF